MDSWGWALFKQGRLKEAEKTLRQAAELAPFSPEIHMHLGETLLALEQPEEALEQWDRALAYAFPERKALEARVRELRTRLAKQQAERNPADPEAPLDPTESDLEEDAL
jgi:tetratricopeptide (TPR) repeat protein